VVVEGKIGKLESDGRVSNTGVLSDFYKPQIHPSHFPHSWEVGGPNGGRGASVFNNYRQLIRRPFCIMDGFLFVEPRKERLHSYQAHLFTQPSDSASGGLVTSLIYVVRCFFSK